MERKKNEFVELIKVEVNERNEQVIGSAKELYLGLGLNKSHWERWSKTNIVENEFFKENVDWIGVLHSDENPKGGRPTTDYIITLEFAKHLINGAKSVSGKNKMEILKALNLTDYIDILSREEIEFFDALEEFFDPIGEKSGIRQYSVLNYRIDYYIEDYKLAIEYDENDHKGYTYEQQELRQQLIEKELGCKFLRLSSSDSFAYNIGLVTRELLS